MDKDIEIKKINGNWFASYLGTDNSYHWIADARTKNKLIVRLSKKLLDFQYEGATLEELGYKQTEVESK